MLSTAPIRTENIAVLAYPYCARDHMGLQFCIYRNGDSASPCVCGDVYKQFADAGIGGRQTSGISCITIIYFTVSLIIIDIYNCHHSSPFYFTVAYTSQKIHQ